MGLWKDKKRGDWRYSFQCRGKVYAGGGFKTKAEARAAREERRKSLRQQTQTPIDTGFLQVANAYLDWSRRRHAEKTYKYKKMVFRSFLKFHGNLPLKKITPQHLHAYLNTRPTNNNYNAHRKELCALFTFARKKLRVIDYNPCWDLEKMPVIRAEKIIPTQEEILRIIAASDPETERPLILVLIHTLARINEILGLRWEDVNFTQNTIRLWTRKRRDGSMEYDILPMNEDLRAVLWGLWERRKQDYWVFYNEKTGTRYTRRPKLMKSLCRRAGVRHFGFHAIRHFVASYLADQQKIGKKTISSLLRHKSLATTEVYLHSISESQKEAMRRLEGVFNACGYACGFESSASKKPQSSQ